MGTPVVYPDTLPCPTSATVTPTERRLISDIPGEKQYRGLQRDFHGTQDLTWIFTAQEANIFWRWWLNALRRGGYWFAADWPLPGGNENNVYRFMAPPAWSYQGGGRDHQGIFTVTAKLEIRGRGMLPVDNLLPPMLTTTPYPLDPLDAMENSGDFIGSGRLYWPTDYARGHADFVGGTLVLAFILKTYSDWPHESISCGSDFVGGTLGPSSDATKYSNWPDESVSSDSDFVGGTLSRVLVVYPNYPTESTSSAGDFISGTLTLG